VKLFQIEEPDGSPADPDMPGTAIGIDASVVEAAVAVSVGGNPVALADREGFEVDLAAPSIDAAMAAWQQFFEGARMRAERALARPVSHAVLALAAMPKAADAARLGDAAAAAGLTLLRVCPSSELPGGAPSLAAAVLAEDLAPRP
jgi:hypothetical protein